MSSGCHLLDQTLIKHLLFIYQNKWLNLFYFFSLPQILTTAHSGHHLPPVTFPWPQLNYWRVKTPFLLLWTATFFSSFTSLLTPVAPRASKTASPFLYYFLYPFDTVGHALGARPRHWQPKARSGARYSALEHCSRPPIASADHLGPPPRVPRGGLDVRNTLGGRPPPLSSSLTPARTRAVAARALQ